jgi:hypothetical protein
LGDLFSLGSFLKITEAQNGVGYILGEFLTNSSGHPGRHKGLFHELEKRYKNGFITDRQL